MILTYESIFSLLAAGVVLKSTAQNINATSLDVVLGDYIMREMSSYGTAELGKRIGPTMELKDITQRGYFLHPGEFILAQTREIFNMPNNLSAEFKLKSSAARMGLEHLTACWIDPGFHDSVLTLELHNMTRYHRIYIKPGDKIGQIVFFKHDEVAEHLSYRHRGSYNKKLEVTGVKRSK